MAAHAFTSFSYSYLNRARVLVASLRRLHPDWVLWAVITDKPPPGFVFDLGSEDFDRTVTAEELFGATADNWLFGHDIVEACTAVKGRALQRILAEPDAEKVLYFDPDIVAFNTLDPVLDLLDVHSIVLTPHQVEPEPPQATTAIIDNEIGSLQYGTFNLGFVAVNRSEEAHQFAAFWADRLFDWCHDRLDIGVFVDQKWCNLVPCFFDDVKILRDPGYNVASWNLSHRTMTFDADGAARINGALLRFYHFTKLGPTGDTMTRRYAGDNTEIFELWHWYRRAVSRATDPAIPAGWWHYGTFDDGSPVEKSMRETFRSREDLRAAFADPFRTGPGTYSDWLKTS